MVTKAVSVLFTIYTCSFSYGAMSILRTLSEKLT